MAEWLLEYYLNGFSATISAGPVNIFRIAIALAAAWKVGYELMRGSWNWFSPLSLTRYEYEYYQPRLPISLRLYRAAIIVKIVAVPLLLLGVLPHVAALALGAALTLDLLFHRLWHTLYIATSCFGLALCDGLGAALSVFSPVFSSPGHSPFTLTLLVILTISMYWGSVLQKLRSAHFMSGTALREYSRYLMDTRDLLTYREVWFPSLYARVFDDSPVLTVKNRFSVMAKITIVLEALLPIGLLFEATWAAAAVCGVLMHVVFTFMYPTRLVPFSVATVGSYALFASQWF
ncbi:hypothetical protein JYK22_02070, partial [Nonomuraea sp. RK-328]|nr:hypothetical protein [Nonomuraea sp. RK-328]